MRVIAGEFGGRRLHAPPRGATRPTADRVREALFSMLSDVAGALVLDLYAGSGALGIEALSRGAASVVFVESDVAAAVTIRRNLETLGVQGEVRRQDALRFLAAAKGPFDLVFCDPPYDSDPSPAAALAERLSAVTSNDARIVTESDKRRPLELPFPLLRERNYGHTRIAIHGR